jgi:hypothetical protein
MAASLEAWTGDPPCLAPDTIPTTLSKYRASSPGKKAISFAALEAWIGGDPLVRDATSFAASLEAWTGYPSLCVF